MNGEVVGAAMVLHHLGLMQCEEFRSVSPGVDERVAEHLKNNLLNAREKA